MTYTVQFREGLERETRGIPAGDLQQILASIRRFAETGYGNVKAMKGKPGQYRLRFGDWRVRFALDPTRGELVVQHILHRREAYRD